MAASTSAATVKRYQASLRSPHNALHSPSWGERSEAPHGRYIWDFPYIWGERSEAPHGRYIWDFPYIYIYILLLLGRAQRSHTWTIHLGFSIYIYIYILLLGRAQRSPTWTIHLGFSIYVYYIIYYYRRTSDRSNFAWRRTARRLTAHAHRCVKLKQGQSILNKVRKGMQAKSKR